MNEEISRKQVVEAIKKVTTAFIDLGSAFTDASIVFDKFEKQEKLKRPKWYANWWIYKKLKRIT
jgi:hypothetical protein